MIGCLDCLRRVFTVYSFVGPLIVDLTAYIDAGQKLGISMDELPFWTWHEEQRAFAAWDAYMPWSRVIAEAENRETSSASGQGTSASGSAQNGTFPYPLLHHLVREKTSLVPSGSSSR